MRKLGQCRTFYSKLGQIRTKKENIKKLGQIRILGRVGGLHHDGEKFKQISSNINKNSRIMNINTILLIILDTAHIKINMN